MFSIRRSYDTTLVIVPRVDKPDLLSVSFVSVRKVKIFPLYFAENLPIFRKFSGAVGLT